MALTQKQIATIKDLYKQGKTQRDIQKETGFSSTTVCSHIKDIVKEIEEEKQRIAVEYHKITGETLESKDSKGEHAIQEDTMDLIENRVKEIAQSKNPITMPEATFMKSFMEFITKIGK